MEDDLKIGLALSIAPPHHHHHHHHHKLHILFPPKQEEGQPQQEGGGGPPKRWRSTSQDTADQEDKDVDEGSEKKKLRLTQEQASLLEDTFKEHNTLTSFQKQELASRLKLKPRQVEVWFQNRRARNKLKQTEVEFQLVKKWCDSLNEENRRLKQELQELKKLIRKKDQAVYLDPPKAGTLALHDLCPACAATTTANSKDSDTTDSCLA